MLRSCYGQEVVIEKGYFIEKTRVAFGAIPAGALV